MHTTPILLGAGLLAGAMNALAGGGSFVTLAAMVATGLPSVAANASSTVALYPAGAAITRRDDAGEAIAPAEALTEGEVLWAHTRGPALAAGWDDEGIIRSGARAAFTLWDRLGGQARALVL